MKGDWGEILMGRGKEGEREGKKRRYFRFYLQTQQKNCNFVVMCFTQLLNDEEP